MNKLFNQSQMVSNDYLKKNFQLNSPSMASFKASPSELREFKTRNMTSIPTITTTGGIFSAQ